MRHQEEENYHAVLFPQKRIGQRDLTRPLRAISGHYRIAIAMSALLSKADIYSARGLSALGQKRTSIYRLGRASLTADFVVPLPFHASPFSSSNAKQLGWCSFAVKGVGAGSTGLYPPAFSI